MAQDQQYVTFGLDEDVFGIPVDRVKEIIDPGPIARLPQAPPSLLGLMDVRGAGIPIVDFRETFGLRAIASTPRTRVIIVESGDTTRPPLGLLVECVFEVTNLGGNPPQPPPVVGDRWKTECVTGIGRQGDTFVVILDPDRLIAMDETVLKVSDSV